MVPKRIAEAGSGFRWNEVLSPQELITAASSFDEALAEAQARQERLKPKSAAAPQNAVVYGTVYDAGREPMPRVTVTLENAASGYRRSMVTKNDGTYNFAEVPPADDYRLTVSEGSRTLDIRAGITVNAGDERVILPPLKEQTVVLALSTQPGATQVYLNDEFKGATGSDDGKLLIRELVPGSYRIRLSAPGYEDWRQDVSLTSNQTLEAKLTRAVPPPFTLPDIVKMLEGDMHPKRVATLVGETGVDFTLTDAAEKQLRAAGADAELLVAIAKAKK